MQLQRAMAAEAEAAREARAKVSERLVSCMNRNSRPKLLLAFGPILCLTPGSFSAFPNLPTMWQLREHPLMTSANFPDFLTPSLDPLVRIWK